MENLVIYRKYRPQKFSEFIGQKAIVKTITNSISKEQISHAYLFSGPRGTGKTTLARLFAKAVNCQNRKKGDYEPCNKCQSCLEITKGISMDLVEIDAASNRGIDEIRSLKESIGFLPSKSKFKVFIIDEAHQLSKDATNALLKTLEEPPKHAIFILATTEIHKMIPTISSRCQRFNFKKLTVQEIVEKLEKIAKSEKIDIEKKALDLIAQYSDGSLRDAETMIDQVIVFFSKKRKITTDDLKELFGITGFFQIANFVDLLINSDLKKNFEFFEKKVEEGLNIEEFLKDLISYLRDLLLVKINPEFRLSDFPNLTKEEFEKMKNQAKKIDKQKLDKILETLIDTSNTMRFSPILQLPLELAIVKIKKIIEEK